MRVFSHCELDHFEDGCVGCKADGKGDCAAVFVDVTPKGPVRWVFDWCWRSWLFGFDAGPMLVLHFGPFAAMRVKA